MPKLLLLTLQTTTITTLSSQTYTLTSSSVDCKWRNAPSGTYSGSRWSGKVSCDNYCDQQYGGALSHTGSGRNANLFCSVNWGASALELRLGANPTKGQAKFVVSTAAGLGLCMWCQERCARGAGRGWVPGEAPG